MHADYGQTIRSCYQLMLHFCYSGHINPIHNYVESCSDSKGISRFITKQISIGDAFADVIYVAMETSFSAALKVTTVTLGIYLHNGPVQTTNLKDFFLQNFSLIYTVEDKQHHKKWIKMESYF